MTKRTLEVRIVLRCPGEDHLTEVWFHPATGFLARAEAALPLPYTEMTPAEGAGLLLHAVLDPSRIVWAHADRGHGRWVATHASEMTVADISVVDACLRLVIRSAHQGERT